MSSFEVLVLPYDRVSRDVRGLWDCIVFTCAFGSLVNVRFYRVRVI